MLALPVCCLFACVPQGPLSVQSWDLDLNARTVSVTLQPATANVSSVNCGAFTIIHGNPASYLRLSGLGSATNGMNIQLMCFLNGHQAAQLVNATKGNTFLTIANSTGIRASSGRELYTLSQCPQGEAVSIVSQDQTPPKLVSASVNLDTRFISLSFDEPLLQKNFSFSISFLSPSTSRTLRAISAQAVAFDASQFMAQLSCQEWSLSGDSSSFSITIESKTVSDVQNNSNPGSLNIMGNFSQLGKGCSVNLQIIQVLLLCWCSMDIGSRKASSE